MQVNPITPVQHHRASRFSQQSLPALRPSMDKFELTFSGHTMAEDREARNHAASVRSDRGAAAQRTETARHNATEAGEAIGMTTGGVAGGMAGAAATITLLGTEGGAATAGGTAVGASMGREVGGGFFKGIVNFFSELKNGNYNENVSARDAADANYTTYNDHLSEGYGHLNRLDSIATKALTALKADGVFVDNEYKSLAHGLYTPYYDDVETKAIAVKPKAGRVPGFIDAYKKITKKPWVGNPALDLQNDIRTGSEETQILALKRLHLVEENPENSSAIYRDMLTHSKVNLAATALREMAKNEALRTGENESVFVNQMERFLISGNPTKVDAALDAIMATKYRSGTINANLKKLTKEGPHAQRMKAMDAQAHRIAQGTDRHFDSQTAARKIIKGFVGNKHLESHLQELVTTYTGRIEDNGNKGPALAIILSGETGIGKTRLVRRIQDEFNNDPDGLVTVKLGSLKSKQELVSTLQKASPLQGKTVFFDELQALDTNENLNPKEKQAVFEFLKQVFDTEIPEGRVQPDLKRFYNIDPKNMILAVGSNQDLLEIESLNTRRGAEVRDRIDGLCEAISLEDDLKPYIPKFVDTYTNNRYYDGTDIKKFSNLTRISDSAKLKLTRDLTNETSKMSRVSGRKLTNDLTKKINTAFQANSTLRQNPNRAFIIDLDRRGNLIAQ